MCLCVSVGLHGVLSFILKSSHVFHQVLVYGSFDETTLFSLINVLSSTETRNVCFLMSLLWKIVWIQ